MTFPVFLPGRRKQIFKCYCSLLHILLSVSKWMSEKQGGPSIFPSGLGWRQVPEMEPSENRDYLSRQTQENKFSPGNMHWLSTCMTIEHDNDKYRPPLPASQCIRNTNFYESLNIPTGGICISSPPLSPGELTTSQHPLHEVKITWTTPRALTDWYKQDLGGR